MVQFVRGAGVLAVVVAPVFAQPACPEAGDVVSQLNISISTGGLNADLDPGDSFGRAVARIGDLDGDGIAEIAVGAPFDDDGQTDAGAVHILFLNADGTVRNEQKISVTSGGWAVPGVRAEDWFGTSVAGIGDLNGDGVPDLAVGVPGVSRPQFPASAVDGAVDILFLNADGTINGQQRITTNTAGFTGDIIGTQFGNGIASVGDIDSDGVVDLVVGAPIALAERGACWVLFMRPDGTVKNFRRIAPGEDGIPFDSSAGDQALFGWDVTSLGDLDGDGRVDIAVTAPLYLDGPDGGLFFVELDSDGSPLQSTVITASDVPFVQDSVNQLGAAVTAIGDLDQDGTPDLAVSSLEGNGVLQNRVWILFLNPDRSVKAARFFAEGIGGFTGNVTDGDIFGAGLALIDDPDQDGSPTLAVGAASLLPTGNFGSLWLLEVDDCATLPAIIQQPALATAVNAGQPVNLSVVAVGDGTLSYQWSRDGQPLSDDDGISGSNAATLVIESAGTVDAGVYTVAVSSAFGSAVSGPATVAVRPAADPCPADLNGDNLLDLSDVIRFIDSFNAGCD